MTRLRPILALASCAVLVAPAGAWAIQARLKTTPQTVVDLAFPARPGGPPSSALVSVPGRTPRYQVVLKPIYDTDKHLVMADLELCRVGEKAGCGLLAATGHRHGLQPYSFLADDYADHARPPVFGQERHFALPKRGLYLNARVAKTAVKPFTKPNQAHHFTFDTVTVEVVIEDAKTRKR